MHFLHRAAGRAITTVKGRRGCFDSRRGLTILGWHRIGNLQDGGLSTTRASFEAQLDRLLELDARVLPMAEGVDALTAGTLPPRAVCLTFDDGYSSVPREAWPLLKARNLPMTLFVVPGYLSGDRAFPWDQPGPDATVMTADEVRDAAADGMDIQSHSWDHRWLPGGRDDELLRDLTDSRTHLEELLGRPVTGLAYPTGGWGARVRDLSEMAGYRYAVTVDRGMNRPGRSDPLALRRSMAPGTADELELLLDGGFDHLRQFDNLRRRSWAKNLTEAGW